MRVVLTLGSMTVYARVFLAFLKGLISADRGNDAYLFHTRLRAFRCVALSVTLCAVNRLSLMAQGSAAARGLAPIWQFNAQHAARSVNGRSVVIILSDGTTPIRQMPAAELARLKRRGTHVWLNLLRLGRYEPVARGMAAVLPFLDHFAAASTLADLPGSNSTESHVSEATMGHKGDI